MHQWYRAATVCTIQYSYNYWYVLYILYILYLYLLLKYKKIICYSVHTTTVTKRSTVLEHAGAV